MRTLPELGSDTPRCDHVLVQPSAYWCQKYIGAATPMGASKGVPMKTK